MNPKRFRMWLMGVTVLGTGMVFVAGAAIANDLSAAVIVIGAGGAALVFAACEGLGRWLALTEIRGQLESPNDPVDAKRGRDGQ